MALLKEEFGVEVTVRQVVGYDPTRASYDSGERWREFFHRTREEYVSDSLSVPIAKQGFRLRSLQEMHDKAKAAGNYVLAADLLEQAAKEVGGRLTNARNLTVSNDPHPYRDLTPEERRAKVTEIFQQALARRAEEAVQLENSPASTESPTLKSEVGKGGESLFKARHEL